MFSLYLKEIRSFLSSIIGYVVIIVFLLLNSLFTWVFPGQFNTLEAGYSNLDTLFIIAPWVFLFLIPAITMRTFAEEQKNGTIELLLTKPLTEFQLVFSKYLSSLTLVFIALVPTLIYYISIYQLGNPVGNIDAGGTLGSYIGLFCLSSVFISIGVFASSLTHNQIVAFILTVFLCFFFYTGFEAIGSFLLFGALDSFIINLGINAHFISISRGVVDTRDLLYFVGLTTIFLLLTQAKIKSRKW
ncbi:MAG: ABC-2 type transport system permease protein [Flavobacteriales bacterium]|jgi:ABC-2 type transport system permease protein